MSSRMAPTSPPVITESNRATKTKGYSRSLVLPVLLMLTEYREEKEAESLLLDKPIANDDIVFNNLGKHLLPNTITQAWQKLIKRTGLPEAAALKFDDIVQVRHNERVVEKV